ncbi:MAG TPA: tetratricopeptide repeat protein [Steroidobacteraceae bacterium]|jgi:tetratricopeptide (TPR) repeat protein|nr:tetratricopeptide repeat protein [Steroidobacteraceae bacterium]
MRTRALVTFSAALLLAAPLVWAIPSPSLEDDSSAPKAAPSAQDSALYTDALKLMKQGDDLQGRADAREAYASARTKLQSLVARSPQIAEAWNALGYTQRRLGAYDDALASYARALELKPGYPEALEYRGEAYLRMNRIQEAKQAYLDLFATNRTIAATLLESMRSWLKTQRGASAVDASVLTDLEQWVQERSQIATQTAALTRAGAAASWR